jgi:hypothetical protein
MATPAKQPASPKPTGATSLSGYLASIPEPRRSDVKRLHALIRKAAPGLRPAFDARTGMIGYGPYHYRYASGREGDSFVIALASQKQYISLYLCCTDADGAYVAEKHRRALAPASVGKSCIRFRRLEQLDVAVLERVVREGARARPLGA